MASLLTAPLADFRPLICTRAHCRRQSRILGLKRDPEARECGFMVLGSGLWDSGLLLEA